MWVFVILLIVYLVAFSAGKKKKREPDRASKKRAARRAGDEAVRMQAEEPEAKRTSDRVCDMAQETIPEGEDRCHPAPMKPRVQVPEPLQEAPDTLAQDVLRGVVMSEILTRPCERRTRRGYHG